MMALSDGKRKVRLVSPKNCANFIFTVTLANVGRFLNSFNVGIRNGS